MNDANRERRPRMAFDALQQEHARRTEAALAMGGPDKLAKRAADGLLNARERLARLFDPGTFEEIGLFAVSHRPQDRDRSPADGKICGYGRIEGRPAASIANDLTVFGASSSHTNVKKMGHVKRVATQNGMPIVFLGESSGARMPDVMGAEGMGSLGGDPTQYLRLRETPWVSAILGPCFGSSAWYACLSDFTVMRKGATMAVSSPRVTSLAINQAVDPEELGGWKLHSETTGQVDLVVETDAEAIDAIKRFLSYLPSHQNEPPPVAPVPAGSDDGARTLPDIVPEARNKVYDVRRVIRAIADRDSYFPLKDRFGMSAATALIRLGGRSVGVLASNPMFKAGALDADACDKAIDFLVLCDSYNIPVVILVDTPGFLIGVEGERKKAPGKIMNFMQALQGCSVPKLSVVLRKTYGQAFLNMGGGRNSDETAAWFTAEVSFMDPAVGVNVVYGVTRESDPARFQELHAMLARGTSAYDFAGVFGAQAVIDPCDTRAWLIRMLDVHGRRLARGVGKHALANWPTTY